MVLDDRPRDRQSHPDAARLGREERLEHLLLGARRQPGAVVAHHHPHLPVALAGRPDRHHPARQRHLGHGVDGVVDDVEHRLLQQDADPLDAGRLAVGGFHRDRDPVGVGIADQQQADLADQRGHVEHGGRGIGRGEHLAHPEDHLAGAAAVVDDVVEALLHAVEDFGPRFEQVASRLGVAEDAGERLIQLVRDRRGQLAEARSPRDVGQLLAAAPGLALGLAAEPGVGQHVGDQAQLYDAGRRDDSASGRGHPQRPAHPAARGKGQHHDRTEAEVEDRSAVVGGLGRNVGGPDPGHDLAAAHQGEGRREAWREWPVEWPGADVVPLLLHLEFARRLVELQDHRAMEPQELADAEQRQVGGHRVVARVVGRDARQQLFELQPRGQRGLRPAVIGEQSGHAHQRHRDGREDHLHGEQAVQHRQLREGPVTGAGLHAGHRRHQQQRGAHAANPEAHRRPAEQRDRQHDRRRGHDLQVVAHGRRAEHHHAGRGQRHRERDGLDRRAAGCGR